MAAGELSSVKIGASRRVPGSAIDTYVGRLIEEGRPDDPVAAS
jgi:hypothetical protein